MPYAPSWLAFEEASGGRMVLGGSPENIKAQYDQLVAMLMPHMPPPSENVVSKDGEVDSIQYRLYNPKNASGPLPVAIWAHGGGYMTGDLNSDDVLCRVVCEHTNSVVVNIDYRLTPDYKWPTQLEDCMKVYRWAHANANSIGGDPNKFYTIGASAGGGLALQVANQVLRDSKLKGSLKGIAACVPFVVHPDNVPQKYQAEYKSYTENGKGVPIIDRDSMDIFFNAAGADHSDTSLWTLLADNHKDFPPTYITSCEYDPLRDDAKILEAALKEAGVPTKHDFYPGMPHYFWSKSPRLSCRAYQADHSVVFPGIPEAQQYVGNLLAGIGWLQSQM